MLWSIAIIRAWKSHPFNSWGLLNHNCGSDDVKYQIWVDCFSLCFLIGRGWNSKDTGRKISPGRKSKKCRIGPSYPPLFLRVCCNLEDLTIEWLFNAAPFPTFINPVNKPNSVPHFLISNSLQLILPQAASLVLTNWSSPGTGISLLLKNSLK